MKTLFGLLLLFTPICFAAKDKANTPVKQAPVLSKSEQEFVKQARQVFKDGKKRPAPSVHMQDKMQSSVKQ